MERGRSTASQAGAEGWMCCLWGQGDNKSVVPPQCSEPGTQCWAGNPLLLLLNSYQNNCPEEAAENKMGVPLEIPGSSGQVLHAQLIPPASACTLELPWVQPGEDEGVIMTNTDSNYQPVTVFSAEIVEEIRRFPGSSSLITSERKQRCCSKK